MGSSQKHRIRFILTFLTDLFFIWVLVHFGMGGWENAVFLLTHSGFLPWIILSTVLFLLLYRSDYRIDIPLFLAGCGLGFWGEWWGTTRGVWTYWNGATPPDYLPPLWGIGLITVYRLSGFLTPLAKQKLPGWSKWAMLASFFILPVLAFSHSLPLLAQVSWYGKLDIHFFAGILVALILVLPRFNLEETFILFVCGMLLGGIYEYLGTSVGEWTYITLEMPPLWIAPLWGFAAAAMVRLAQLFRWAIQNSVRHLLAAITANEEHRECENQEKVKLIEVE